jgi:hypothetical protein
MDEQEYQSIHISPAHYNFNLHVVWLFVPAIVFILVFTLIVRATPQQFAAEDSAPVLGEQTNEK